MKLFVGCVEEKVCDFVSPHLEKALVKSQPFATCPPSFLSSTRCARKTMSAPPGRSATVTSLSGRVNALKFMQRASASASSSTSSSSPSSPSTPAKASTQTIPLASPSPAQPGSPSVSVPGSPSLAAAEEDQWTLAPAAIAKLRAKAAGHKREGVKISQEAGFDAWLIEREKKQPEAGQSQGQGRGQRQTFGSLKKRPQEDDEEQQGQGVKKRSKAPHDTQDGLEPEFQESEESEVEQKPKGFVKPGSVKKQQKQGGSPSGSKKAKKNSSQGSSKDQDKVVYARKRGGKLGISGGGR